MGCSGVTNTVTMVTPVSYTHLVLSNCRKRYMDANRNAFHMDQYFDRYYDCESYDFAPKTEIFREIDVYKRQVFILISAIAVFIVFVQLVTVRWG